MKYLIFLTLPLVAQPVSQSLTPRMQLSGSTQQMDIRSGTVNLYGTLPTQVLNDTVAGLRGWDEGASTLDSTGRLFIFGGDAVGIWFDSASGKWLSEHKRQTCNFGTGATYCLGSHPLAFFNSNITFEGCHLIENLRDTLLSVSPLQPSSCPSINVITDSSHTTTQPKFSYHLISPAGSGELYGAGNPPTGLWTVGTAMYANHQAASVNFDKLSAITKSILIKHNTATTSITSTTPQTWNRLFIFSQLPSFPSLRVNAVNGSAVVTRISGTATDTNWANATLYPYILLSGNYHTGTTYWRVTNVAGNSITLNVNVSCTSCNNLEFIVVPNPDTNTGKFSEVSCEKILAVDMPSTINSALPATLQGKDVNFCFGASGWYRKSNMYLLVFEANTSVIDGMTYSNGLSDAFYLSATTPTWTSADETTAIPMFNSWLTGGGSTGLPCIGENSVRWYPLINRWVATYGSAECGGLRARMSDGPLPWLWSSEVNIMLNHNQTTNPAAWHARIVKNPSGTGTDFNLADPVYDPDTAFPYTQFTNFSPYGLPGNAYGAYQLPREFSKIHGRYMRIYTIFNTFDPYTNFIGDFLVYGGGDALSIDGRATVDGRITLND